MDDARLKELERELGLPLKPRRRGPRPRVVSNDGLQELV